MPETSRPEHNQLEAHISCVYASVVPRRKWLWGADQTVSALLTGEAIDQQQVRYEKLVFGLDLPSFLFLLPAPPTPPTPSLTPHVFYVCCLQSIDTPGGTEWTKPSGWHASRAERSRGIRQREALGEIKQGWCTVLQPACYYTAEGKKGSDVMSTDGWFNIPKFWEDLLC